MPGVDSHRSVIARRQLVELARLLAAVQESNPFYQAKLNGSGLESGIASLDEFTARCPFTTKPELSVDQQSRPPYGSNLTFPLEQYSRFHQTSGTSGAPLRWLDTPASWEALVACWKEVFLAAGVDAADRILFAFSFGPFLGFWLAFEAAQRIGCLCLPGGGLSSAARLRLLLDNGATVVCCTPTYAARLAEVATNEGIDLKQSRVRLLMVAGEPGGSIPATREHLQRLWPGARVFDHHGMTEVGPVTYQCPQQPGILHVMESAYLAEVLEPQTGKPVSAGENGELILTTLKRLGSPLLRYRTGDLVRAVHAPAELESPLCACGRGELALTGGILGRVDDMVIVRGVNVYPSAVEEIIRACGGIAEYQVHLKPSGVLTELSLRIELASHATAEVDVVRRLQSLLQESLTLRIPVSVAPAGSLPRFEMKARRWIRD